MRTACAEPGCARTVTVRTHWLCCAHRRARGRAFMLALVGSDTTESTVLRELVFSFPASCVSVDHFLGHFYAVTRCWTTNAPCRAVLKQHALLGKVHVGAAMSRADVTELVTRFAAFTVSNARAFGWTRLVQTCADRVAEWYPSLVLPAPLDDVLGAERMLTCLPARFRPFLVFSDLVRALRSVLPRDATECVFLHYIGIVRRRELDSRVGGFRFVCDTSQRCP